MDRRDRPGSLILYSLPHSRMPFVFMQRLHSAQQRWMRNQNPIIDPPLVQTVVLCFVVESKSCNRKFTYEQVFFQNEVLFRNTEGLILLIT